MTDAPDDSPIVHNRVLLSLKPEAQAFLKSRMVTRQMSPGEVLYETGAPFSHAIFPHTGAISLMTEMEGGRSIEKASVGREGFVGLALVMGGRHALSRSTVQLAGYASWLSLNDLDAAHVEFSCVRHAMQNYARAFIVQLMESVACNSLHNSEPRVARWLLEASDRMGDEAFLIKQDSLSHILGLRRATVSEACSRFQGEGFIRYRRGLLLITDREGLERRACGCYGRIRSFRVTWPPT